MTIADLPALTQARLITEMEYDPSQVDNVKEILDSSDPAGELVRQQEKVALDIIKPGTFPGYQHRWPVFQMYFREAYDHVVAKTARERKGKGVGGLGNMGDWLETLVKEAMPLVKEYGVPLLKKNIEVATKTGEYSKEAQAAKTAGAAAAAAAAAAAGAKVKEEVAAAQEEQEEIAHDAAPATNPKPKGLSTGAKVGIGAAAVGAVALVALIAMGGKRR